MAPVWTTIASKARVSMAVPRIVGARLVTVDANGMNGVFMSSDGGVQRPNGERDRPELSPDVGRRHQRIGTTERGRQVLNFAGRLRLRPAEVGGDCRQNALAVTSVS